VRVLPALAFLMAIVGNAHPSDREMRVYSYLDQPARIWLIKAGMEPEAVEGFVRQGLKARAIRPIDDGLLYEGSEDALRIDIRKTSKGFLLELSVRQGASAANMLQRWRASRFLSNDLVGSSETLRAELTALISTMLDALKIASATDSYRQGSMLNP